MLAWNSIFQANNIIARLFHHHLLEQHAGAVQADVGECRKVLSCRYVTRYLRVGQADGGITTVGIPAHNFEIVTFTEIATTGTNT